MVRVAQVGAPARAARAGSRARCAVRRPPARASRSGAADPMRSRSRRRGQAALGPAEPRLVRRSATASRRACRVIASHTSCGRGGQLALPAHLERPGHGRLRLRRPEPLRSSFYTRHAAGAKSTASLPGGVRLVSVLPRAAVRAAPLTLVLVPSLSFVFFSCSRATITGRRGDARASSSTTSRRRSCTPTSARATSRTRRSSGRAARSRWSPTASWSTSSCSAARSLAPSSSGCPPARYRRCGRAPPRRA